MNVVSEVFQDATTDRVLNFSTDESVVLEDFVNLPPDRLCVILKHNDLRLLPRGNVGLKDFDLAGFDVEFHDVAGWKRCWITDLTVLTRLSRII